MYIKKILLLMVLCSSLLFAGGDPGWFIDDTDIIIQKQDHVVVKLDRVSSYQRLKRKYELEVGYSEELLGRISVLQDDIELRDVAISVKDQDIERLENKKPMLIEIEGATVYVESEPVELVSEPIIITQEAVIIEKEHTVNDYILVGIIAFILGGIII